MYRQNVTFINKFEGKNHENVQKKVQVIIFDFV